MKKTSLLAAAAMMIAANVGAQTGYDDTKHEVAIRYGVLPNSKIFHNNVDYENETYSGSFSAEYFYHINKWLGIGSIFVYGKHKQELYDISSSKHISYDDRVFTSYGVEEIDDTIEYKYLKKLE